jgi:hypothetical protein
VARNYYFIITLVGCTESQKHALSASLNDDNGATAGAMTRYQKKKKMNE